MLSLFFVYTSQTFTMHEQQIGPKTTKEIEQPLQATVDTKNKNNDTTVKSEATASNKQENHNPAASLWFPYPGAAKPCSEEGDRSTETDSSSHEKTFFP